MFFVCDFCSKKCVITRQVNHQKIEMKLFEKVEIKNRLGFEKVAKKVNPNVEKFYSKYSTLLIKKPDNSLHQLFIKS
ncbi:hypothetical protein BCT63_02875 [Vibrio kanaloae]|nr:hypothetical protein BCT63_02875 [Vibrio kanaloae]